MAKSPFLLPALLVFSLAPAQAQICTDISGVPGVPAYTGLATSIPDTRNCIRFWSCFSATTTGTTYTLSPAGCDPTSTTCTATAAVVAQFKGNRQSYTNPGIPPSAARTFPAPHSGRPSWVATGRTTTPNGSSNPAILHRPSARSTSSTIRGRSDPLGNAATYDLDTLRSSRTEQAKLVKLTGDFP